jgi:hypothetical protein
MQDLSPRIRTPRPSGPRFSLVVVINLNWTILALRTVVQPTWPKWVT